MQTRDSPSTELSCSVPGLWTAEPETLRLPQTKIMLVETLGLGQRLWVFECFTWKRKLTYDLIYHCLDRTSLETNKVGVFVKAKILIRETVVYRVRRNLSKNLAIFDLH